MKKYMVEVRCCCVPKNLLGWLPIYSQPDYSDRYTYAYLDYGKEIKTLELQIEGIQLAEYAMAFKSDNTPLETLRKIPCFVENK